MAVIETKFGIGDRVWVANWTPEQRQHPCPDCLGSRKWQARSPAGGVFEVECPRCSASYMSERDLSLVYILFVPDPSQMTIGQVRGFSGTDDENSYMCHETGIGSGNIWRESLLFATKEEAVAVAQAQCDAKNSDANDWVAKQYDRTAKFSDYQLKDASIEAAKSSAWSANYRVRTLIEDLTEAETLEEVKNLIETWREDIVIQRTPLQLYGLAYRVTILDQHMQIGCELHSLAEWAAFDDRRILAMDGKRSATFWAAHKDALLSLARSDGRSFEPVEAPAEDLAKAEA